MRKSLTAFLFFHFINSGYSQSIISDSAVYLLHKWQQPIGREKYLAVTKNGTITYTVDFKYIDRGSPVQLKDSLVFTTNMDPVYYRIIGGTSRFSKVNDSVVFHDPKKFQFPIDGYSPATAQMLLIQYWNKNNRPKMISTPPSGQVEISRNGVDTMSFQNRPEIFIRYIIKGLIWGNELLWTDTKGVLVCLITNDAEGDKQEMMLDKYESLLPVFIGKSALYGMKLFSKEASASIKANHLIAIRGGNLICFVPLTLYVCA